MIEQWTFMIWFVAVGILAGLLTGIIMKARRSDFIGFFVVGITGSAIGGMFYSTFGNSAAWALISAVIGAAVLLGLIETVKRA